MDGGEHCRKRLRPNFGMPEKAAGASGELGGFPPPLFLVVAPEEEEEEGGRRQPPSSLLGVCVMRAGGSAGQCPG